LSSLSAPPLDAHNALMETSLLRLRLATMLVLVACVALNIWLFRVGVFWGILGLNVTKHVAIAQLCHAVGLNRTPGNSSVGHDPKPPRLTQVEPSSN
jgi:hypothetical protein